MTDRADRSAEAERARIRALGPEFRRVITNAYYDTRNEGGTMETAADRAVAAVLAAIDGPASAEPGPDGETKVSEELLRAVLLDLRRKDMPDGPCWCSVEPNATNRFTHERKCRDARAALATPDRADQTAAIEAGTHEPAVDDFGNQYLARLATPDRADLC